MSELQDEDYLLLQRTHPRLANARRQMQQMPGADCVAISGGRAADGAPFCTGLLADRTDGFLARRPHNHHGDDRSDLYRFGAHDPAQCDHLSAACFRAARAARLSDGVCRKLLFGYGRFADKPFAGVSPVARQFSRRIFRGIGWRWVFVVGWRAVETASRGRGHGDGRCEDDVCRRRTFGLAVDDPDSFPRGLFGGCYRQRACLTPKRQGSSDANSVWYFSWDWVDTGLTFWRPDDRMVSRKVCRLDVTFFNAKTPSCNDAKL